MSVEEIHAWGEAVGYVAFITIVWLWLAGAFDRRSSDD